MLRFFRKWVRWPRRPCSVSSSQKRWPARVVGTSSAASVSAANRGVLQRGSLVMGPLRDLRSTVVAYVRTERGHQHQRLGDELRDAVAIDPDAIDAEFPECPAGV